MANQMVHGMGNAAAPGMAPPPPPAAWHVAVNGESRGPFTPQQLSQAVAAGQLNSQSLVWSATLSGWTPAGQVPQLGGLFGQTPPPPPPPPAG
jgi:hypothetical protein